MVCSQRLVGRLFTRALTRPFTRALRFLLVGLVALALSIAPPLLNVKATEAFQQQPMTSKGLIPIEDQPFYPLLLKSSETWSDVVLDQVVGDSPRTTLLNFYSVMADVGLRADRLGQRSSAKEQSRQEQIDDTNLLFALAVKALDSSSIPKSVRDDMADEAAIQLKHVLDYVFTHSRQLIEVPDVEGMKELNDRRSTPTNSWRIPGTAVTLTSDLDDDPENESFYFLRQPCHRSARCTTRSELSQRFNNLSPPHVSTQISSTLPAIWYHQIGIWLFQRAGVACSNGQSVIRRFFRFFAQHS